MPFDRYMIHGEKSKNVGDFPRANIAREKSLGNKGKKSNIVGKTFVATRCMAWIITMDLVVSL